MQLEQQRLICDTRGGRPPVLLKSDDGGTSAPSQQPIGGAGVIAKLIELLLNGTYRLIRRRTRWCWCRQGTCGWASSESAPAFRLKLASVRLDIAARAFQSTASVAETAAATVVVGHHRIEPIHIGVAVVVENGLSSIHADVFGQTVPDLRRRKNEVLSNRWSCFFRARWHLRLCRSSRIGRCCVACRRGIGWCRRGGALVCFPDEPKHPYDGGDTQHPLARG